MRSLILHIGTEKTGTTSIQSFLDLNRAPLALQGVYVPDFLDLPNHRKMPVMFQHDDYVDDYHLMHGLDTIEARRQHKQALFDAFAHQLQNVTLPRWIISSEQLQSRLTGPADIETLAHWLKQHFDDIKVVLYVRNPADTAMSLWSTALKGGNDIVTLMPPDDGYVRRICNHRQTIIRWQTAFGTPLVVRHFASESLVNGCVISDFCHAAGIKADSACVFPARENESLSPLGMQVMLRINRQIPLFVDSRPNPVRANIVAMVEQYLGAPPKALPTEEQYKAYEDYFRVSDEWLRDHFLPDYRPGALKAGDIIAPLTLEPASADIEAMAAFVCGSWSHLRQQQIGREAWIAEFIKDTHEKELRIRKHLEEVDARMEQLQNERVARERYIAQVEAHMTQRREHVTQSIKAPSPLRSKCDNHHLHTMLRTLIMRLPGGRHLLSGIKSVAARLFRTSKNAADAQDDALQHRTDTPN